MADGESHQDEVDQEYDAPAVTRLGAVDELTSLDNDSLTLDGGG